MMMTTTTMMMVVEMMMMVMAVRMMIMIVVVMVMMAMMSVMTSLLLKGPHSINRCLTADQRRLVLETRPRPTALYMKLVCDTALTWPSYATDADTQLKPTSSEMIIELFGG